MRNVRWLVFHMFILLGLSGLVQPTIAAEVTWKKCADAREMCDIQGTNTIRYGTSTADEHSNEGVISGPFRCHHLTTELGPDPAVGADKQCWYSSVKPASQETWSQCAPARENCRLESTKKVRYGLKPDNTFNEAAVFGNFLCHHSTPGLGPDPAVGKDKWCWVSDHQAMRGCTPIDGYPKCVMIDEPWIVIRGTEKVSDSALSAAYRIYSTMTMLLKADRYPKNKMDNYTVYITNGESLEELKQLSAVGSMWNDADLDEFRGGTTRDYLWISEQMICKTGVKTRNAAHERGDREKRDNTNRTFDQVVHEFAHALDYRYGHGSVIRTHYTAWGADDATEYFPWIVQYHFGTPAAPAHHQATQAVKDDIAAMFSGTATFSCDMYQEGK